MWSCPQCVPSTQHEGKDGRAEELAGRALGLCLQSRVLHCSLHHKPRGRGEHALALGFGSGVKSGVQGSVCLTNAHMSPLRRSRGHTLKVPVTELGDLPKDSGGTGGVM